MTARLRPTHAEVDLDAIRANVHTLAAAAGDAAVCAVVKADGYGHGAVPVARAALDAGASWLAVALVEEGEELRDAGIDAPILVLTEPPPAGVDRLLAARLTPAVYTARFGRALDAAGRGRGEPVAVHVKADTGMGRVGVPPDGWEGFLAEAAGWSGVRIEALWSHMARADEPDAPTTAEQQDRFDAFLALAGEHGIEPALTHTANSAATLVQPRARRDLVRVGIAMYGLSPSTEVTADGHGLVPALRFVTEVGFAKRVTAGTPASYGHTWSAPADGWLASLPVGYADGVPRLLSNRGEVLLRGLRRPIVGNVCMDQLLVWCGDDEPHVGDEVVLLGGQDGARVTADEWAAWAGTITYEIATGITRRVPRLAR
ncbi:MAG: alanine racemase [Actinobacteria bacterium]|nr:alanine racemase [Actinomycetota bacterium]